MAYIHSNPERENDEGALPNIEVFYHDGDMEAALSGDCDYDELGAGWYWQACFPGCLPDGEPCGPFDTEADAIADAQSE